MSKSKAVDLVLYLNRLANIITEYVKVNEVGVYHPNKFFYVKLPSGQVRIRNIYNVLARVFKVMGMVEKDAQDVIMLKLPENVGSLPEHDKILAEIKVEKEKEFKEVLSAYVREFSTISRDLEGLAFKKVCALHPHNAVLGSEAFIMFEINKYTEQSLNVFQKVLKDMGAEMPVNQKDFNYPLPIKVHKGQEKTDACRLFSRYVAYVMLPEFLLEQTRRIGEIQVKLLQVTRRNAGFVIELCVDNAPYLVYRNSDEANWRDVNAFYEVISQIKGVRATKTGKRILIGIKKDVYSEENINDIFVGLREAYYSWLLRYRDSDMRGINLVLLEERLKSILNRKIVLCVTSDIGFHITLTKPTEKEELIIKILKDELLPPLGIENIRTYKDDKSLKLSFQISERFLSANTTPQIQDSLSKNVPELLICSAISSFRSIIPQNSGGYIKINPGNDNNIIARMRLPDSIAKALEESLSNGGWCKTVREEIGSGDMVTLAVVRKNGQNIIS